MHRVTLSLVLGVGMVAGCLSPAVARAETVYDFTVTGGGYAGTLTFTATGPVTIHDHPHLQLAFAESSTGTWEGVSGYPMYIAFYYDTSGVESIDASSTTKMPGAPTNVLGQTDFSMYGPTVLSLTQTADASSSDGLDDTFSIIPGTYTLTTRFYGDPPITLTIIPETAATPEPSTVWLLASGGLGLLALLMRRPSAPAEF